ncbi:MAG: Ig domain-containing protein [Pseudomonadota bacterium]
MQHRAVVGIFAIFTLLAACGGGGGAGGPQLITEVKDDDASGDLQADAGLDDSLLDDGIGPLPDGMEPPACEVDSTTCIGGKLATCDGVWGWLLETCPEGQHCEGGACVAELCEPFATRCAEGDAGVQVCGPAGEGWSDSFVCPEEQLCQDGICVSAECEPGEISCVQDAVVACNEDGTGWDVTQCEEAQVCLGGACIECVDDVDCDEGLACEAGLCTTPSLEIISASPPDGKVDEDYTATMAATGGVLPYEWVLLTGDLPPGLDLDAETGVISGVPGAAGAYPFTVAVQDATDALDSRTYTVTIHAGSATLIITTGSPLPNGEEGTLYQTQVGASGGLPPYIFGITGGGLPVGLDMSSSGLLSGVPQEHGTFTFTVKVFDDGDPVGVGSKAFDLTVEIAPLNIVADTIYDLWIVKIVVLPLITVVQGIPIPYSKQLEAHGGVKPYHWQENDISGAVSWLIPNAGLPDELTLEEDGLLHGAVTDPSKVAVLTIPFTGISLTGFFFMGQVTDSQNPADSDTGLFLVPTLPISF